jgi:GrpB-like predicted nucleotidyltransferase (UPF0157 family)
MTWYEFLVFFHISTAVIWIGGGAMVQFFALRPLRSSDPAAGPSSRAVCDGQRGVALAAGLPDRLRADPALAADEALKRDLAVKYRDDRPGYTEARTEFVTAAIRPHPAT